MKKDVLKIFLCLLFGLGVFLLLKPERIAAYDVTSVQYGNIPWPEEKSHLDNFAFRLRSDPNLQGVIEFKVGSRDKLAAAEKRALRAKKYLISKRKVDANSIATVNGGSIGKEETWIILFAVEKRPNTPNP